MHAFCKSRIWLLHGSEMYVERFSSAITYPIDRVLIAPVIVGTV